MDSGSTDAVACSDGGRVGEGFPEHATSVSLSNSFPRIQDTNGDRGNSTHIPGTSSFTGIRAMGCLENAPSLNSFQSLTAAMHCNDTNDIRNESVPSAGSRNLSSASALLNESLDSGSLTGNQVKPGLTPRGLVTNLDMSSGPFTSTEINNAIHNSVGTETSNLERSQNDFTPTSSYMEVTARSNINERLADLNSGKNNFLSNDLDESVHGAQKKNTYSMPRNITTQMQSLSLNTDISMTSPKTGSTKSTQTDPTGQDQDRYGGAAAAGSPDTSMTSGPTSSLPTDDVLVRKLKRPVILWLQTKLETNIGKAWQDLADLHDWDYDRITDFESSSYTGKSPFCRLLAEPEFQMYTINDLKQDLVQLPRKDILHDLDSVMRRHYK